MGRGLGLGGILVVLVLSLFFGEDVLTLLQLGSAGGPGSTAEAPYTPSVATPEEEALVDFVSFILDDLQATWDSLFLTLGGQYEHARLVLFRDAIDSACGYAQSATGPFYCPGDRKVYIDLGFYDELHARFGAPGDFAQAYVLAHEVGHHVQVLLGVERQVRETQMARPELQNELSVLMELQADCLAGVWGHSTAQRQLLEQGDVEEGLGAASAIGDDRIQRQTQGYVSPESFTHGSSAQRVEWFRRGLASGDPRDCDTFDAAGR
jgi:predicted metalloprotease